MIVNPQTKEDIMENLIYLLNENKKMESIECFKLKSGLDCSETDRIRWTFLESIIPDLNEFVRNKWKEKELKKNLDQIDYLESRLKSMI